ncbi:DeoR/GlpR family transcriptional regulator [Providencia rustigianii]
MMQLLNLCVFRDMSVLKNSSNNLRSALKLFVETSMSLLNRIRSYGTMVAQLCLLAPSIPLTMTVKSCGQMKKHVLRSMLLAKFLMAQPYLSTSERPLKPWLMP